MPPPTDLPTFKNHLRVFPVVSCPLNLTSTKILFDADIGVIVPECNSIIPFAVVVTVVLFTWVLT